MVVLSKSRKEADGDKRRRRGCSTICCCVDLMDLGLTGKLVLVTGSTKGIGKAIAEEFLRNGARTIVNGRSEADVEALVAEFNQKGYSGVAVGLSGDVSNAAGEELAANFVESQGQPLDVLVNNVGIFEVKDFFLNTDEDWDRYFQPAAESPPVASRNPGI